MAERGKGFPRINLVSAIQIIDAASKFGKSWKKEQFAGFGAKNNAGSAKSGAFAARLSSMRDYNLITTSKENVSLTELAIKITKPVTPEEREKSIRQAFLSVAPFADLYASFDGGQALPKDKVAEHAVYNLGISRESMDKFVNVFIDSGEHVGLIIYDKEGGTVRLKKVESEAADEEVPDDQADQDSRLTDLVAPPMILSKGKPSSMGAAASEQGVNHAGDGWTLTVLLKTSKRLSPEMRKKVRDLLEAADELADELHSDEGEV